MAGTGGRWFSCAIRWRSMKASKNTSQNEQSNPRSARQRATTWQGDDSEIRAISKEYENPVTYDHPYPSMKRFAEFLALRYDCTRTCHAYYRQMRLLHEHFQADPADLLEEQLRDYFLHVKLEKEWFPKTIRQCRAAAQMFYTHMLGKDAWTVFSQVKTKDHDILPAVLTREEPSGLRLLPSHRQGQPPARAVPCGLARPVWPRFLPGRLRPSAMPKLWRPRAAAEEFPPATQRTRPSGESPISHPRLRMINALSDLHSEPRMAGFCPGWLELAISLPSSLAHRPTRTSFASCAPLHAAQPRSPAAALPLDPRNSAPQAPRIPACASTQAP